MPVRAFQFRSDQAALVFVFVAFALEETKSGSQGLKVGSDEFAVSFVAGTGLAVRKVVRHGTYVELGCQLLGGRIFSDNGNISVEVSTAGSEDSCEDSLVTIGFPFLSTEIHSSASLPASVSAAPVSWIQKQHFPAAASGHSTPSGQALPDAQTANALLAAGSSTTSSCSDVVRGRGQ